MVTASISSIISELSGESYTNQVIPTADEYTIHTGRTDNCPIFALYLRKIRQQELLYVKATNKAYNQRSSLSSKPKHQSLCIPHAVYLIN
jgi:hypothetical protein